MQSASGSDTMSLDIGTAGTDRVVAVYLAVEDSGTSASGVTVDGKSATLVAVADNPNSVGNHSELWYIDEDALSASTGTVTIAAQGVSSLWGIQAVLLTGVDQSGPTDFGIDNTSVGTTTITPTAIDVPEGGAVVMGGGEGSQNRSVTAITSPLTVLESHDPSSADMFLGAGIESSAQTDKAYVITLSSSHNRASGVVASWAPAAGTGTAVSESVTLSTTDGTTSFTVTDDQTWLTVDPTEGTTDTGGTSLDVIANPTGLTVGDHTGIVTVTANGYNPVDIPVTLSITTAGTPSLVADPSSLSLSATEGGPSEVDTVSV